MEKTEKYPQRIRVKRMPFNYCDSTRGSCCCTGWEVRESPDPADWWYEFEDPRTGERFLAR